MLHIMVSDCLEMLNRLSKDKFSVRLNSKRVILLLQLSSMFPNLMNLNRSTTDDVSS